MASTLLIAQTAIAGRGCGYATRLEQSWALQDSTVSKSKRSRGEAFSYPRKKEVGLGTRTGGREFLPVLREEKLNESNGYYVIYCWSEGLALGPQDMAGTAVP